MDNNTDNKFDDVHDRAVRNVTDTIYQAVPIDGTSREIRLIEMLPGLSDAKLSCKLTTMDMEDLQLYTAVSYTWGDPSKTEVILLNGEPFLVRENLGQFLRQTRISGHRGLLWIDALCINQASNRERNHQVKMMGDIYSKASSVMVWLGSGTTKIESALNYLNQFPRNPTFDYPIGSPDFASHMLELCRRPYWTRLWIVQEFVLAKRLQICCGQACIDGSSLMSFYDELEEKKIWKRTGGASVAQLLGTPAMSVLQHRKYWMSRDQTAAPLHLSLGMALERFSHMDCTDPRDHVYGLLSLIRSREVATLALSPDYSKSARWLFDYLVSHSNIRPSLLQRLLRLPRDLPWSPQVIADSTCDDPFLSDDEGSQGAMIPGQS